MKTETWEFEIKTSKFKVKERTSDFNWWKKQNRKILKLYKANEIYHEGNHVVVYYKKKIGKWKSKRLDGVKV